MIKLLDILNESYNPNIYQINCKIVTSAGNRNVSDIISDIRAIPGITIVNIIDSDYNTEEGKHTSELSLKIDPSPFNPFNSESYDKILPSIKKLPDVRGAKYTSNPISINENKLHKLIKEVLQEKEDRCKRIADRKYDKPSAYKSGAIVRCRKGNIWKDLKEAKQVGILYHYTSEQGLKNILQSNKLNSSKENYKGNILYYISFTRNKNFHKKKNKWGVKTQYRISIDGDKLSNKYKIEPFSYIPGWNYENNWEYDWLEDESEEEVRHFFNATGDYDEQEERIYFKNDNGGIDNIKNYILSVDKIEDLKEDESLHKWFKRQGPKGKESGWVDCNAPDGKGGYKACGRKEGEKRAKYPSCRPTPAKCKTKGKGKKWGKTK